MYFIRELRPNKERERCVRTRDPRRADGPSELRQSRDKRPLRPEFVPHKTGGTIPV